MKTAAAIKIFTFDEIYIGDSSQLAESSSFYVIASTNLSYKSLKIRVNSWIEKLKSYRYTYACEFSQICLIPHSLDLQPSSAHKKTIDTFLMLNQMNFTE